LFLGIQHAQSWNNYKLDYPASHFNIPMEAVDRIELVCGTGSLQFGVQIGGMLIL